MSGARRRTEEWIWTWKRELVAKLIAQGDKSVAEIAAECRISERGIYRWKAAPEFRARVREHVANYQRTVFSSGYSRRDNRILLRQHTIDKCLAIIAERGARPEMQKIPGGSTGMLTLKIRQIGGGRVATEYLVDVRIDEVIRANLREIAQELGEWREIRDVNGATDENGNIRPIVLKISPTQMAVAGDRIVDVEAVPVNDAVALPLAPPERE
jgi:hypothetical protein